MEAVSCSCFLHQFSLSKIFAYMVHKPILPSSFGAESHWIHCYVHYDHSISNAMMITCIHDELVHRSGAGILESAALTTREAPEGPTESSDSGSLSDLLHRVWGQLFMTQQFDTKITSSEFVVLLLKADLWFTSFFILFSGPLPETQAVPFWEAVCQGFVQCFSNEHEGKGTDDSKGAIDNVWYLDGNFSLRTKRWKIMCIFKKV